MDVQSILREIMYKANINQSELARLLEVSQVTVSRIKNNKQFPKLKLSKKIVAVAKDCKIKVKLEDLT